MTRLLVSVRSLDEALIAASAGVDLIDVKEPTHGSLGMADVSVRHEIGQRLGAKHQLSAACGELRDFVACSVSKGDKVAAAKSSSGDAWTGYRYAKIGLAGCADASNWRENWHAWRSTLLNVVEPVLVCYIDGERCNAPGFEELLTFATQAEIRMLLFDTWDKHRPGLCELWQPADFLRVSQALRQAKISFVFAGKLELENVSALRLYGADYLGIRGAVCDAAFPGDDVRCGKVNTAKINSWRQALRVMTINPSLQQS